MNSVRNGRLQGLRIGPILLFFDLASAEGDHCFLGAMAETHLLAMAHDQ